MGTLKLPRDIKSTIEPKEYLRYVENRHERWTRARSTLDVLAGEDEQRGKGGSVSTGSGSDRKAELEAAYQEFASAPPLLDQHPRVHGDLSNLHRPYV